MSNKSLCRTVATCFLLIAAIRSIVRSDPPSPADKNTMGVALVRRAPR